MDKCKVIQITNAGGTPSWRAAWNLNEEEMLLRAAWIQGLTAEDVIHRYALFLFIQTHICNKSEEQLQRTLESSKDWQMLGDGEYVLSRRGESRLTKLGPRPPKANLAAKYAVKRQYKGHVFAVEIRPGHPARVFFDGQPMSGVNALRKLNGLDATFRTHSSSAPRKLLNWAVQDNDFTWTREG